MPLLQDIGMDPSRNALFHLVPLNNPSVEAPDPPDNKRFVWKSALRNCVGWGWKSASMYHQFPAMSWPGLAAVQN
jgi:hypothetical protein